MSMRSVNELLAERLVSQSVLLRNARSELRQTMILGRSELQQIVIAHGELLLRVASELRKIARDIELELPSIYRKSQSSPVSTSPPTTPATPTEGLSVEELRLIRSDN